MSGLDATHIKSLSQPHCVYTDSVHNISLMFDGMSLITLCNFFSQTCSSRNSPLATSRLKSSFHLCMCQYSAIWHTLIYRVYVIKIILSDLLDSGRQLSSKVLNFDQIWRQYRMDVSWQWHFHYSVHQTRTAWKPKNMIGSIITPPMLTENMFTHINNKQWLTVM